MVATRFRLACAFLLAGAFAGSCAGTGDAGGGGGANSAATAGAGGPKASGGKTPAGGASAGTELDLQAMLAPVPEYEGAGRNLFAFGAARRAASQAPEIEPPPVEPAPREIVTLPPQRPSPRLGGPSSARLDMKYAGFLEKTGADGVKSKYAIFLDGNEILAGAEGELIANRFKVVEIGLESVTVSPSGSNATQRIPLQSK
jgi:hypothetical protein